MTEEIKEILDKLRETADYPKLNYSSYDKSYNETIDNVAMIKSFACKQLLDYITNLQQELNKYKNNWEELKKWLDEIINDDRLSAPNASTLMYALNKIKELEKNN